jgi:hypothetical protein
MHKRSHVGCMTCLAALGHYLLRQLTQMDRSIDDGIGAYWWPWHPELED